MPLQQIENELADVIAVFKRYGIDVYGMVAYSLHAATANDYQSIRPYLIHDMQEHRPDLLSNLALLHTCIDFLGEAGGRLMALIERLIGFFDPTMQVEGFLDDAIIISFQPP